MREFTEFATTNLRLPRSEIAPDGCTVHPLLALSGGTMGHFELSPGQTSRAVVHRTVEEFWFVLSGKGELWRKQGTREEVVVLEPGICATLTRGTHFQFRAASPEALAIIAVTIPRWPGDSEAAFVPGPWPSSVSIPSGLGPPTQQVFSWSDGERQAIQCERSAP